MEDGGQERGLVVVPPRHQVADVVEERHRPRRPAEPLGHDAQELHDEVGQALTAVMLGLGRLARKAPSELGGEITKLAPNTRYYIVCRAQDEHQNEDVNVAYRTILTLNDSTPPVFNGLELVTVDSTTAELSWSAATDDKTPKSRIVYLVYQATTAGGEEVAGLVPLWAVGRPGARIEAEGRALRVRAESLHGAERERAWARIVALAPGYGEYALKTDREIRGRRAEYERQVALYARAIAEASGAPASAALRAPTAWNTASQRRWKSARPA